MMWRRRAEEQFRPFRVTFRYGRDAESGSWIVTDHPQSSPRRILAEVERAMARGGLFSIGDLSGKNRAAMGFPISLLLDVKIEEIKEVKR